MTGILGDCAVPGARYTKSGEPKHRQLIAFDNPSVLTSRVYCYAESMDQHTLRSSGLGESPPWARNAGKLMNLILNNVWSR